MLFQNLTENQIEEYREIFRLFDKQSRGVIKNNRLKSVLSSLGHYLNNSQINGLVQIVDKDKSGTIDFQQFIFMMAMGCQNSNALLQDAIEIFNFLDQNGSNKITRDQMLEKLSGLSLDKDLSKPERITEMEGIKNFIEGIFEQGDANGDGELDFQEFLEMVLDFN